MTRMVSTRHEFGSRAAVVASLAILASFVSSAALAQDLDLSGIAKEEVKQEAASNSSSLLPSFGGGSSKTPSVASSSSSWSVSSVLDPFGLFTSAPAAATPQKPARREGLGTVSVYHGGAPRKDPRVVTKGGAWWDPLELFYPAEEAYEYDDVNDFLNQPRTDP